MPSRWPLLLLLLLTSGCIPYVKDITSNAQYKKYWGDYQPGAVYRLVENTVLVDWKYGDLDLTHYTDGTPRYFLYPQATSNFAYPPEYAIGVVPAGTHLRFQKLLYRWYFEGETTYPMAVVSDGPFKGREVSLGELSQDKFADSGYTDHQFYARYFQDPRRLVLQDDHPTTRH